MRSGPSPVRQIARRGWRAGLAIVGIAIVGGCTPVAPPPEIAVEAAPREAANHPEPLPEARSAVPVPEASQSTEVDRLLSLPVPERPPLPPAAPPQDVPPGLENGVVFGRQVYGLHPELLARLVQAEKLLAGEETTSAASSESWGVETISGYRRGSRSHEQGLAIDINYYANPYIMHESGDEALDAQLAPVYHRIARLVLDRDSVIPERLVEGSPGIERALQLYDQLEEESRAMAAYFRLMRDRDALARFLNSRKSGFASGTLRSDATLAELEAVQRQMLADYVALTGREGPAVAGMTYPEPLIPAQGDRPFMGDPTYRAPEFGLMSLRREVVEALLRSGLRWGGTDMGNRSGDLMHFYLPESLVTERKPDANRRFAQATPSPSVVRPAAPPSGNSSSRSSGEGKTTARSQPVPKKADDADELGKLRLGAAAKPEILKAQVLLDRVDFSPGIVDGTFGANMKKALKAYQQSRGLQPTGKLNPSTWKALETGADEPVVTTYAIAKEDVAGPFVKKIPTELKAMAKLERLAYTSPLELLAEKFHTSEKLLKAMNPEADFKKVGTRLTVPNVRRKPAEKELKTVVVDKNLEAVKGYDASGKLAVFFPASIGSEDFPSPKGSLKVVTVAERPVFTHSGKLEYSKLKKKEVVRVAPGPNNPVGNVWIDLNKDGYGIHGTPDPARVSRAESHGCVRLTNWNAQALSRMVEPGTPVRFAD